MSNVDLLEALPMEDREGPPLCERALVGALLIDGGLRARARHLDPSEFQDRALGKVFEMLMDIDGPVDLIIAVDEGRKRGLNKYTGDTGLAVYLASLLDLVPDVENVAGYADRVKRASTARRVTSELEKMRLARLERGLR